MLPSRISLHFAFKKIEQVIEQTLKLQVLEQVAINQQFIAVGRTPPPVETLNLCRRNDQYVVVQTKGYEINLLSVDDIAALLNTLPAREHFPVKRYLSAVSNTSFAQNS